MLLVYGCVFSSISLFSVYMCVRMLSSPRSIAGVPSGSGASGLPYYCTPPVCVPAVLVPLGGLTVWRNDNNQHFFFETKKKCHPVLVLEKRDCLECQRLVGSYVGDLGKLFVDWGCDVYGACVVRGKRRGFSLGATARRSQAARVHTDRFAPNFWSIVLVHPGQAPYKSHPQPQSRDASQPFNS